MALLFLHYNWLVYNHLLILTLHCQEWFQVSNFNHQHKHLLFHRSDFFVVVAGFSLFGKGSWLWINIQTLTLHTLWDTRPSLSEFPTFLQNLQYNSHIFKMWARANLVAFMKYLHRGAPFSPHNNINYKIHLSRIIDTNSTYLVAQNRRYTAICQLKTILLPLKQT